MLARILQFRRNRSSREETAIERPCQDDDVISIEAVRGLATESALASPFDIATVVLGSRTLDAPRRLRRCA